MNDYREDLAWIHHEGFTEFASSAAPGVIALLRAHGIEDGLVVDIGCGSGVLADALTRAGYEVLGIDASPAMIELARAHAPNARFEVGRFDSVSIPPCRAITAMGEVLNYGPVHAFVYNASRALADGGVLLFDIAERGSYPAHDERRIGDESWSVIVIKDSDGTRLTRRVLTFRELDGVVRRDEEVHALELYDRAEMLSLLRDAGFTVRVRRSYGTYRLPKGLAVYQAVKRERRSGGISGHASFVRPKMR